MVNTVKLPVVASGGIATAADLAQVAALGAAGCIVGRALYDGGLSLTAAATACGDT
jgi:phosphoribosylformimino-5-aminoimidazole carboxamide ribotide isomerase